jgi:hypothetical protein
MQFLFFNNNFTMRQNAFWLVFLSTLFMGNIASSQSLPFQCGTKNLDELKLNMLQIREEMRDFVKPRNAITYVPVRFFLVAKSDGSGRPSERLGLQALCNLNENYAGQDIQFYLKEFKYYNNTSVYNNPSGFSGYNAIDGQMIYNAINVFVVDDAGGGAAAYYQGPSTGPNRADWIVVGKAYVDDVRVLSHEVGHFFSLPHPFHGWESSGGWDPAIHGNPVGFTAPDGQTANEFVDGTNCSTAGDAICDTPADYMFLSGNCTYTGNAKDPHGELVSPLKENIMNYHFGCSTYSFTPDQKTNISNSLFHSSRNYVRPAFTPNLVEITSPPAIISPAQGETVDTYNWVVLEWEDLAAADYYLVEIANSTIGTVRFLVDENQLILNNLDPNKGYLWKVLAFNDYSTCTGFSSLKIFKTGDVFTDTFEVSNIDNWWIQPNPARGNDMLSVNLETPTALEINLSLRTMTGQEITTIKNYKVPGGISIIEIPTSGLPAGMYLVTLQSKGGIETKHAAIVD